MNYFYGLIQVVAQAASDSTVQQGSCAALHVKMLISPALLHSEELSCRNTAEESQRLSLSS